jgi:PAS domain S-box-containing protein
MVRLMGYGSREELMAQAAVNLYPNAEERQRFRTALEERGSQRDWEVALKQKDGRLIRCLESVSVSRDAVGRIVRYQGAIVDITERMEMAERLHREQELARLVVDGSPDTIAVLDGNGIYTFVSSRVESLIGRKPEDTCQQARRAADIVNSLLTFSQPAAMGRHTVRLEDILRQVLVMREEALESGRVSVKLLAPANAWQVQGDSTQLPQVFLNLIVNAKQAIQENGSPGKIAISIRNKGRLVVTEIQDNGPGIRPEILPHLFDPFFTTKRPGGGTGLGLTMSLALVKGHGGTLEAENASEWRCQRW